MTNKKRAALPVNKAIVLAISSICAGYTVPAQAVETVKSSETTKAIEPESNTAERFVAHFDPIVITATKTNKRLSDSPIAVQVLDKNTLNENQARTLKQALDLLPNVYLSPLHGKTGYEVRMQGFSGEQVLVLIDGLPVSASTGSTFNISQYLNTDIEQIEVIQGAASAQFGSSAMGGVINIITKPIRSSVASLTAEVATNGDQNPSDKSFDNNYSFVQGSIEGAVSPDQRLKARFSGSYLEDKGLTVDQDKWPNLKDETEQKQSQLRLSLTPDINEIDQSNPSSRYWLEVGYYEEDDISRFNYSRRGVTKAQQRDEHITRQRMSAGGHREFGTRNSNSLKLSGSILHEDYESDSETKTQGTSTQLRNYQSTTNLAQLQLDLPLIDINENQWHALQLGVKYSKDKMEQVKNDISELISGEVDREVVEGYIQDDWVLNPNTEIVAGVRYQDDSEFGGHYAPKLAVKQDFYDGSNRKHTIRASVGKGYRIPNLKELYYYFDHSIYGYQILGNPLLEPEKSVSYQLGYATDLTKNIGVSVNGFYNDIEDLIEVDSVNYTMEGPLMTFIYKNVDEAKTYGGDVAIDWQLGAKTDLNLGYAYLKAENKTTGSDLTLSPEHKVTANVQYQVTEKLQLVPQLRYESKQLVSTTRNSYSPSWWGMDVKANYSVTPNFDVYMAVNNVFDKQRDTNDNDDISPIDNRQWLVGVNFKY